MEIVFILNIKLKKINLCGSYCSFILFCMLLYSMNFKTAVLKLYYNKKLEQKRKLTKRKTS